MITCRFASLLSLGGLLGALCAAAPADTQAPPAVTARERNKAEALERHGRNLRAAGTDTNLLVRPGLLADRARRKVVVYAESIRLQPGAPVEFPLISEESGKDYEALAVAFARPSDVHDALTFIGVPPGQGVDTSRMRFWPRGERIDVTFRYGVGGAGGATSSVAVRAERLVLDTRTGKPLPEAGFVFTGSSRTPMPDSPATGLVYAADVFSPNSIVSVYNEPGTVLDVPRRAAQHDVYTFQVPNPEILLPEAHFIEIDFQPQRPAGAPRVLDLTLRIVPSTNGSPDRAGVAYLLAPTDQRAAAPEGAEALRRAVDKLVQTPRDPFVTILPDDALTLSAVRTAASLIDSLEVDDGIRVEPPPPGHPYYRAFLPDEKHRRRADRPFQPWEFHVGAAGGGITGDLVRVDEEWRGPDMQPVYRERHAAVASVSDLAAALRQPDSPAVVLVFAPPDLFYGRLRRLLAPALEDGMILYVFLPQASDVPARPGVP